MRKIWRMLSNNAFPVARYRTSCRREMDLKRPASDTMAIALLKSGALWPVHASTSVGPKTDTKAKAGVVMMNIALNDFLTNRWIRSTELDTKIAAAPDSMDNDNASCATIAEVATRVAKA